MTAEQYTDAVYAKIDARIESEPTYNNIVAEASELGIASEQIYKLMIKCVSVGARIGAQAATDVLKESGLLQFEN